jgi:hypothetical protein
MVQRVQDRFYVQGTKGMDTGISLERKKGGDIVKKGKRIGRYRDWRRDNLVGNDGDFAEVYEDLDNPEGIIVEGNFYNSTRQNTPDDDEFVLHLAGNEKFHGKTARELLDSEWTYWE